MAGLRLFAHVLVDIFADHPPLYRESVIRVRDSVDLDRALPSSRGANELLKSRSVESTLPPHHLLLVDRPFSGDR